MSSALTFIRKEFSTTYVDLMSSNHLQERRFVSEPFVERESNRKRSKELECIWGRQDLIEKARKFLLQNIEYYQFCDEHTGSKDDLTRDLYVLCFLLKINSHNGDKVILDIEENRNSICYL